MSFIDTLRTKFKEAGSRHSATDQKNLNAAHDALVTAGADCTAMQESAFSSNDIMAILNAALKLTFKGTYDYPYISDLYADNVVFSNDYTNTFYRCDYTVADDGSVSLGLATPVVRKVTYLAPGEPLAESETTDLESDVVDLVERAVKSDGTVMLKLISPGLGSSAYYPEDVLKRDGPNVFKKGLHNLIDHPTPAEEAARPEGSIANLGSTLTEDAAWHDDYKGNGPGLYARATVTPDFAPKLNVIAPDIGMSIRARGLSHMGEIDGKQVPIVESLTHAKSVDYVTHAGRGGAIVDLLESKRTTEELDMPIDEKLFQEVQAQNRALAEQVTQLQLYNMKNDAVKIIHKTLSNYPTLAAPTKARIAVLAESYAPPVDSTTGALDTVKLVESVKNLISGEMAYLASLGNGHVRGLGASAPIADEDAAKNTYEAFRESLKADMITGQ